MGTSKALFIKQCLFGCPILYVWVIFCGGVDTFFVTNNQPKQPKKSGILESLHNSLMPVRKGEIKGRKAKVERGRLIV